ncbi:hypothetical protein [Actinoplanes regularis]|uniref:hypothetical protein n=1 Tax=Actinoplanes regularis TaxID=52697 RepID=UPI0024A56212|nr:hypothetical protein [Actinoplanes regularis]GLW36022.1 hypothetical protein Areg01_89570 [Actinoplanes regularis]
MQDPTQQAHDDPFSEGTRGAMQAAASLVTVLEAAARVWATQQQNRAAAEERAAGQASNAQRMQEQAARLRQAEETQWQKYADQITNDRQWLRERASLGQAAQAWQWGTARAGNDPLAADIAADAYHRLSVLEPDLIARYDRLRADNVPVHEAMATAAHEWWEHKWAPRAQPGKAGALPAGPGGQDAFDATVRAQVAVLARDLDPAVIEAFQRQLREQAMVASDGLDLLRQYCEQTAPTMPPDSELMAGRIMEQALRADGRTQAGALDIPRTPNNEHVDGLVASVNANVGADQIGAATARRQAARATGEGGPRTVVGQAFPPLRPPAPTSGRPTLGTMSTAVAPVLRTGASR